MIFELMNGRRCSTLQRDLPQPLCAAMSPDGAGLLDRDAVEARGEDRAEAKDREEEDAEGECEDGPGVKWPPRRGISSLIAGDARCRRYRSSRDLFPTVGIRPPDPRTNRGAFNRMARSPDNAERSFYRLVDRS